MSVNTAKHQRDSSRPFCFHCGNQLFKANGTLVFVTRDYHGTKVKLHKDCAPKFDEDQRP